jgi:dipeptidase
MLRIFAAGLAALSMSACALGASNVTLAKSQNYLVKPALLAEAPARTVAITQVTDAREEATRDRIGDKRNAYGMVFF